MNEDDLMSLGTVEDQGETTVNDPRRYIDHSDETLDAAAKEGQILLDNAAKAEELAQPNAEQVAAQEAADKDQGLIADNPAQAVTEVGKALYGGATDAVESIGSFLDLTGDSITSIAAKIQGTPVEKGQDPIFNNKEYRELGGNKPVGFLDIPERFEVENHSGVGKLTRGMVEFGLLVKATSVTGGALAPSLFGKTAAFANKVRGAKLLRGALKSKAPIIGGAVRGVARTGKGAKLIKFIPKGASIAAEGSVADLISSSSDYANMANLVNEYIPWLPFSEFLAVDPDKDNPWVAKTKTILAGGGANLAFYGLMSFARGAHAARKARLEGKSIEESNAIGNKAAENSLNNDLANEYKQREDLKAEDVRNKKGIPEDPLEEYVVANLDEELGQLYINLTRGNLFEVVGLDTYYHGSAKGLPGDYPYVTKGERIWRDDNLFGNGFYTVNDLTVSTGNRVDGEGLTVKLDPKGFKKVVYRVKQKKPVRFFDAEKPFSFDDQSPEAQIIKKLGYLDESGNLDSVWPSTGSISYSDYLSALKDQQLYPRSELVNMLDNLHAELQQLGYGGIEYNGKQGVRNHKVRVYWDPDTQIDLDKYNLANRNPDVDAELPIFESGNFKYRPPRKPWKTNLEAERGLAGSRGAQYIMDRLERRFLTEGVDAYEAREIQQFIDTIGDRFFGDVSLSITNKLNVQGRFNFGNKLIEIQKKAMEEEGLTHTMIHELWHTLSRYLPSTDVKRLNVEFQNRKRTFLASGSEDAKLFNKKKYTLTNYRYKNLDEWFAETMTDEFYKYMDETSSLAPAGTLKRVAQEFGILLKDMYAAVASRVGGSQARRIFSNYKKQLYENMQRDFTLEMDLVGQGKWNPFYDDDDFITSKDIDETDPESFKRPKAEDLRKQAFEAGEEIGDPWFDDIGQSYKNANAEKRATPDRNPDRFNDSQKSVIPDDENVASATDKLIGEVVATGERPSTQVISEKILRRLADGSEDVYKYVKEFSEELATKIFKGLDNRFDYTKVQARILEATDELYSRIIKDVDRGRPVGSYFNEDSPNYVKYVHDGQKVIVGTAEEKVALDFIIQTLSKRASLLAKGAMDLPPGIDVKRQLNMANDAMVIALREYKKMGYMAGSQLERMNPNSVRLTPEVRADIEENLKRIDEEFDLFQQELRRITEEGTVEQRDTLLELHTLSGGSVITFDDAKEFIRVSTRGGRFKGKDYRSGIREQLRGVFYHSVLSGPRTAVKAIFGTNLIAVLRPYQAWLGATLAGSKKEAVIASAQIAGINEMFQDSLKLFKHNWDLGVNRQAQTYVGKFNIETNTAQFKAMGKYVEQYGTPNEMAYYKIAETLLDFNNSPWVRYSVNAMGAGDAVARHLLGRFEMRMRAARKAIDDGVDLDDVVEVAARTEDNFKGEIFKTDKYGMDVVSDRAATLAGDETALTKALSSSNKGLEAIGQKTGFRFFFPFVRTGINAIDLTWQHTPLLARFNQKFKDLIEFERTGGNANVILKEYGIRKADIPQAIALARGRVAASTMLVSIAAMAAATGNLTGMMPNDKETRDLWRLNKIQPNSIKIGDTYFSYADIEPYNTLLTSVANVLNYQYALGEDVRDNFFEKIVFMGAAVIVDKSMLAGVEDLSQLLSGQTSDVAVQRIFAKLARSSLPYAGLSASLGNLMDENERVSRGFLETMIRRDAIFKQGLPPKYDILTKGNEAVPFTPYTSNPLLKFWNAITPFAVTYAGNDKVKTALRDISFNLPETLRTWRGEELNSFEQSELQRYLAESPLYDRLDRLVSSNRWQSDFKKFKELGLMKREGFRPIDQKFYLDVQRIFLDEKKKALQLMRRDHPDLYRRILSRKQSTFYGKKGNLNMLGELQKHGI
jgi:hypothetical protein|tara:strand:+ start:4763 stop:10354 length:5592 start_codon:yes stop_codon:yes gene_type:complete